MEKKGNIFLIVVLSLLVIALGGYIAYDKLNSKQNNNDNITNQPNTTTTDINSNSEISYNYTISKRNDIQKVRKGYIELITDKKGDVYLYTVGNLDSEADSTLKTQIQSLIKQFKFYSPDGWTGYDEESSKGVNSYKLNISNVLTTYHVYMGNGGFSYFIFVKENGNISYMSYEKLLENTLFDIKNIDNLNNISFVVENINMPYAVDINGNEYKLYEYIK